MYHFVYGFIWGIESIIAPVSYMRWCLRAILSKLKGIEDPEQKRKFIGRKFITVFDDFAYKLEQKIGKSPEYLVQGTLYLGSARTNSHTIKSHHNDGGLPKDMKLKLIAPLKLLFKDEVLIWTNLFNIISNFS
jgi:GMP synthase (glutamine-hydrolysing)